MAARDKDREPNFPEGAVARLEKLPETDIAWFNAGRHPAQQVISVSSSTEQALVTSGHNTTTAISTAGGNTDVAISIAGTSSGNALQRTYIHTTHALGTSAKHVGQALHLTPKHDEPKSKAVDSLSSVRVLNSLRRDNGLATRGYRLVGYI